MMDADSLEPTVRLFSRLLLREIDEHLCQQLSMPAVAFALERVGLRAPDLVELEGLAAEYDQTLRAPVDFDPPIEALWVDEAPAETMQDLIDDAKLNYNPDAVGGAPLEHIGAILLLWVECRGARPDISSRIARHHVAWAERALEPLARADGFYGDLARSVRTLIPQLVASE